MNFGTLRVYRYIGTTYKNEYLIEIGKCGRFYKKFIVIIDNEIQAIGLRSPEEIQDELLYEYMGYIDIKSELSELLMKAIEKLNPSDFVSNIENIEKNW